MIEHRLIERMVALMREQLARVHGRHECDPDFIGAAVDFIRSYADRCHHGKEEDILFRALAAQPLEEPLQTVLQELIDEHARSRGATGRLADANERYQQGEAGALAEIEQCLEELVSLYPQHIAKEDRRFFVPAQQCFSQPELAAMLDRFWEFDRQLLHERYRHVVGQWEGAQHRP